MLETSDRRKETDGEYRPKDPRAPRDPEVLARLSALVKHPSYAVLVGEMEAAERKFIENFATGLITSKQQIDQREVDEKRGFWKGVRWALKTFPTLSANEYDRFVAEALKEADELGGNR